MRVGRSVVAMAVSGALAVAALGGAPSAGAASPTAPSAPAGQMLVHEVQSSIGDAGTLAAALVDAGFDVAARSRESIFVLGPAELRDVLLATDSVGYVGAEPAVTAGGPATPPASQDSILPRRLHGNDYPTFYGGYRTADGFVAYEDDLEAAYPELVDVIDYGESWSGDPLRAVCVTADADAGCQLDPDVDKARFLIVAQTHARELSTSELMWRYLTYLVDGYGKNARVTGLLDGTEVWIVPHVNPDGIRVVEEGITEQGTGQDSPAWHRKNLNDTYSGSPCGGIYASSQEGIDINRNFDIDWGRTGTSTFPCSLIYGGPEAASEPETTAQVELMTDLFRDQRADGMEAEAPRRRPARCSRCTATPTSCSCRGASPRAARWRRTTPACGRTRSA